MKIKITNKALSKYSLLIFPLICFFQEYQIIDFDKSWATVGLKLACSWVCGLIYLVFLLLPNRCCCPIFSTLLTSNSNGTGHFFSRHIIIHLVLPKMRCLIEPALKFRYSKKVTKFSKSSPYFDWH